MRRGMRYFQVFKQTEVINPVGEVVQIALGVSINVMLYRVKVVRTTGAAAATIRPRINNVSGGGLNAASQVYLANTNTFASSPIFDVTDINAILQTDTTGILDFTVNPDVAGDTYSIEVWFEQVKT